MRSLDISLSGDSTTTAKKRNGEEKRRKEKNTNAQCLPFVHTTQAQTDDSDRLVFTVCLVRLSHCYPMSRRERERRTISYAHTRRKKNANPYNGLLLSTEISFRTKFSAN